MKRMITLICGIRDRLGQVFVKPTEKEILLLTNALPYLITYRIYIQAHTHVKDFILLTNLNNYCSFAFYATECILYLLTCHLSNSVLSVIKELINTIYLSSSAEKISQAKAVNERKIFNAK